MTPRHKQQKTRAEQTQFTWWTAGQATWGEQDDPILVAAPDFPLAPLQEHPGLFRDFARISPGRDTYLRFALQYGPLTTPQGGEPLSQWEEEHTKILEAVELMDKLPGISDRAEREWAQGMLATRTNGGLARNGISAAIVAERPFGIGMHLSYWVPNLAAAMWLQVAVAADGDRAYRPCSVCHKHFDATDSPASKVVCSAKCRMRRAYLKRKGGDNNDS